MQNAHCAWHTINHLLPWTPTLLRPVCPTPHDCDSSGQDNNLTHTILFNTWKINYASHFSHRSFSLIGRLQCDVSSDMHTCKYHKTCCTSLPCTVHITVHLHSSWPPVTTIYRVNTVRYGTRSDQQPRNRAGIPRPKENTCPNSYLKTLYRWVEIFKI